MKKILRLASLTSQEVASNRFVAVPGETLEKKGSISETIESLIGTEEKKGPFWDNAFRQDLVDRVIPGGTNRKRLGRSGFLATPLRGYIAGDVVKFVFVGS